jgi:hypothetical protein
MAYFHTLGEKVHHYLGGVAHDQGQHPISDVYGTDGYGKFHILAALACLLVRQKETVVYLPDCRAMLREPLEYLRNALLFAFADSSSSDYRE